MPVNSSSAASDAHSSRSISDNSKPQEVPWSPLDLLSEESGGLRRWRSVTVDGRVIPSYVFIGPRGGRIPIRLALMGGIDPYDHLSTDSIVKLLVGLNLASLLAEDFALFVYPVTNPRGATSQSLDFFEPSWKEDPDSVAGFFDRELNENQLDGIITVKTDEPIDGFQIQVSSRVIGSEVLWPGLELVARIIPLARDPIQVVPHLQEEWNSMLGLNQLHPGPFTLIIRTPKGSGAENQISSIVFSIEQILRTYRNLVQQADRL